MKHLLQDLENQMTKLKNMPSDIAAAMQTSNIDRWMTSVIRLYGCPLSSDRILAMIEGQNIREATVSDYQLTEICRSLYSEFEYMAGFDTNLDIKTIGRLHQIIMDASTPVPYRDRVHFVDEMVYPAPGPARIPQLLRACELEISSDDHQADKIEGAIRTHDMIMAIWPYSQHSDTLAYVCMSYELFKAGYPLPTLDLNPVQHLQISAEFTNKGSSKALTEIVLTNLLQEVNLEPRW
ncbi:MAG: Fic family protein [Firmicutes bacterium]|nr:Fic family protein [Bacillota bacterium]